MRNSEKQTRLSYNLKSEIENRTRGKVSIIGIGNILRGDDGAGPFFIEMLKKRGLGGACLFDCGTAPENYIFPILSTSSDTIILIDSADMKLSPGEARAFNLDEITNISFSTHNPSPRLFTDLLKTGKDDLNIFVVSIQPKSTELGSPLSKEVSRGLITLADIFQDILT